MKTGLNMSKQRKQRNEIRLRSLRYLLFKVPVGFVKIRVIRVKKFGFSAFPVFPVVNPLSPSSLPSVQTPEHATRNTQHASPHDYRHPNHPRLARPTARVVGPARRR